MSGREKESSRAEGKGSPWLGPDSPAKGDLQRTLARHTARAASCRLLGCDACPGQHQKRWPGAASPFFRQLHQQPAGSSAARPPRRDNAFEPGNTAREPLEYAVSKAYISGFFRLRRHLLRRTAGRSRNATCFSRLDWISLRESTEPIQTRKRVSPRSPML